MRPASFSPQLSPLARQQLEALPAEAQHAVAQRLGELCALAERPPRPAPLWLKTSAPGLEQVQGAQHTLELTFDVDALEGTLRLWSIDTRA